MNPHFTFPRAQAPTPRPPANPTHSSSDTLTTSAEPIGPAGNRESNALRASVLDVALQLGIGENGSTVANWMFNDPIGEEDEEDQHSSSPGLTSGSTATSEESTNNSPLVGYNSGSTAHSKNGLYPSDPGNNKNGNEGADAIAVPNRSEDSQKIAPLKFPVRPPPVPQSQSNVGSDGHKKLKKKKGDGNGYESDGGYVSGAEGRGRKSKTKEGDTEGGISKAEKKLREKEEKERAKEEKARRAREVKEEKAKKKVEKDAGYETDGHAEDKSKKEKSRSKSRTRSKKDATYETDDGYISSKEKKDKKSRFFRLGSRASSKSDLHQDGSEEIPPMPELPMPLPIADRFASSRTGTPAPTLHSNATSTVGASSIAGSSLGTGRTSDLRLDMNFQRASEDDGGVDSGSPESPEKVKRSAEPFSNSELDTPNSSGHTGASGSQSTLNSLPNPLSPSLSPSRSRSIFKRPTSPATVAKPTISYPLTRSTSPVIPPVPSSSPSPVSSPASPSPSPSPALATPHSLFGRSPTKRIPSPLSFASKLTGGNNKVPVASSRLDSSLDAGSSPSSDGLSPFIMVTPVQDSTPSPIGANDESSKPRVRHVPSQISIIPSSDYIVPSPLPPSPRLMSPSALAMYDVPPPSPPPTGPLPRPPSFLSTDISRAVSPMSIRSQGSIIQRGRESPFPAKPILHPNGKRPDSFGAGLEARMRVKRYRDLYAVPSPAGGWKAPRAAGVHGSRPGIMDWQDNKGGPVNHAETPGIHVEQPSDDENDEEDGENEEMREVLGRFSYSEDNVDLEFTGGSALKRTQSAEGLSVTRRPSAKSSVATDDDDRSRYPDEDRTAGRSTMYMVEHGGSTISGFGGDSSRNSRWSELEVGSMYSSRASFMDNDKSGETRERFVQRVEAMFDVSGREKLQRPDIPPVPKLPADLTGRF